MLKMKEGFTLIELIMVIVILGILAVVAVPRFIDLRTDAQTAAMDGVEAAIESGAQIWHAKWLIDTGHADVSGSSAQGYPPGWANALDSDTTADINTKYSIGYDATTGHVTSISEI